MNDTTTFENIEVGQTFFDPFSGEYWVKASYNDAEMVTGGEGFDFFEPNDEVAVTNMKF